jgi:hypothetical protein
MVAGMHGKFWTWQRFINGSGKVGIAGGWRKIGVKLQISLFLKPLVYERNREEAGDSS